jgi:Sorting nexin C terminal
MSARASRENSRASSLAPLRSASSNSLSRIKLPPPPDEMPDDYDSLNGSEIRSKMAESILSQQPSFTSNSSFAQSTTLNGKTGPAASNPTQKRGRQYSQLTEQETRVAVELLFAVINELYTLSSAWNIRRTLLAAAKSFLLRPGNPSLVSIQTLMQQSVLDANTSDAGIAAHLKKIRENSMPTDEERAAWPPELTADEKDKLRIKARKLLIQSGVPEALKGVMGQSATTEAMGRVFDSLQIEEVARGLIFGLILQAARVVTH